MTNKEAIKRQPDSTDKTIKKAVALAVTEFAASNPLQQRILLVRYRNVLAGNPFDDDDDYQDPSEYADEERERTRNITNHEMSFDEKIDDPRRY